MNIWQQLSKPIVGLSPMDDISDAAFRSVVCKYAKPDVLYTEFVNVDSILHAKEQIINKLLYTKAQRPIIAQFFGIDPKLFQYAAVVAMELGFDGIDINMGCPSKNVAQRGAGASLIKTPELAVEIINATRQAIMEHAAGSQLELPSGIRSKIEATKERLIEMGNNVISTGEIALSLKTRIGYSSNEIDTWIPALVSVKPDCIAIHGRSLKQMYTGKADWDAIKHAGQIIRSASTDICVLGNGDCQNYDQGRILAETNGLDGVLIGRASLGNPWCFRTGTSEIILSEKFEAILFHARLYESLNPANMLPLRKHLAWYISGIEGAAKLRSALVHITSVSEVEKILQEYLDKVSYSK